MTEAELQAKCRELRRQLDDAPRDSQAERAIEQDMNHYVQRLANVQAGHGDTAAMTGAKCKPYPTWLMSVKVRKDDGTFGPDNYVKVAGESFAIAAENACAVFGGTTRTHAARQVDPSLWGGEVSA